MSWKKTACFHPSAELLQTFDDGTLPEEHVPEIEAHLQSCAACCDILADLRQDGFLARLRGACANVPTMPLPAPSSTPPPHETIIQPEAVENPPAADEVPTLPGYDGMRELGGGGMGVVYAAMHAVMGRRVAVKVIHPKFSCDSAAAARFRREIRAAARLAHPNIVAAHDAGQHDGRPFLVMEFVDGESLGDRLDRLGPLPVTEACEAVRQAALGVQHAHDNGLIHRDLKPHNLMRTLDGTVKVCDFGLAALIDDRVPGKSATAPNALMGTPDYMAPEQAEDARAADGRADVYALGCTLYRLLTGEVPFPEESVLLKLVAHRTQARPSARRARPEVPAELDGVLRRAMARRPQDRFQTPGELAAALRPFADPTRPPSRRRRALPALAAVAFLGTVGIAGLARLTTGEDRQIVVETGEPNVQDNIPQESSVPVGQRLWLDGAYDDCVWGVAFSPDGRYTLTTGHRNALHERASGRLIRRIGAGIWFAAFSPDGKQTLTSDLHMRSIILSETETGEEVRRFGNPTGRVRNAAFSPDGKRIAASEWNTVRVYDKATGQTVTSVPTNPHCTPAFAFTADSRHLLVIHNDPRSIRTYEVESGKQAEPALLSPQPLSGLALSPDGKTVVATVWEWNGDRVLVWNRASGKLVRRLSAGQKLKEYHHNRVVFLPDSRRALVTNFEGTMVLWDVLTGRQLQRWDNLGDIVSLAVSPDGCWALCGLFRERRAFLFRLPDLPALEPDSTVIEPAAPVVEDAAAKASPLVVVRRHVVEPIAGTGVLPHTSKTAFSSDGTMYAAGGGDNLIRIWKRETGELLRTLRGHTRDIHHVTFTPDGKRLVSSSADHTLRVWDTATGKELHQRFAPMQGIGWVDVSPDGTRMVSGNWDGTAEIWDLPDAKKIHCLKVGPPCGAAFTGRGQQVVTWSGGNTLKLWDAASGQLLATQIGPADSVAELRPPPRAKFLLAVNSSGLSWRDPATLREVRSLKCPGIFRANNWGVSPDGRFLIASAEFEYRVRLWDLEAGREIGWLDLSKRPSGVMGFSPDGRHVVSGSSQGDVCLLRIEEDAGDAPKRKP